MGLEQDIKDKAIELGFDAVGITNAAPIGPADMERLRAWLKAGFAGQMQYMARNIDKRIAPAELLGGARSVIVVALNYKPGASFGTVAQYACYEDYHHFMRPLLHMLADFIREHTEDRNRFKVCVDSAPLAERALAVRAGLGFIGKNHMLIHPMLGPQILLGELLTSVRLDADKPLTGTCADCDRCVQACPTGALRADGQFDATRCISYLTMEHKDRIEPQLAKCIGQRLFGCDECMLACPHYQAAPPCANQRFRFHPKRQRLDPVRVLEMTQESFETQFADSPIGRLGLEQLKRNARICVANRAEAERSAEQPESTGSGRRRSRRRGLRDR